MPPVALNIDPATLQGHRDLLEHYSSLQELARDSPPGILECEKKLQYLYYLAQARTSMNGVRRNWRGLEYNPIKAFPVLLKAYEWREQARNFSQHRDNRDMAHWFVAVTAPSDRLEEHLLESIGLMSEKSRKAKRKVARDSVGADNVDSSRRQASREKALVFTYGDDDDDGVAIDNDAIRLCMVRTMHCKGCTLLRSADIARKMHAELLACHHDLPLKTVLNSGKPDFDLKLFFCNHCRHEMFVGSDSEGSVDKSPYGSVDESPHGSVDESPYGSADESPYGSVD